MEKIVYKVVVNHEEQYALWIAGKNNAPGWQDTGIEGMKEECMNFVRTVWTDMRPLSLRRAMEGHSNATSHCSKRLAMA